MSLLGKLKPKFWDHYDVASGPQKQLFNFRRIWLLAVLLTVGVSLVPLIFITVLDYRATRKGIESEIRLRTARLVSNTRRSVTFFLEERRSAIQFITRLHPCQDFGNSTELRLNLGKPETKLRGICGSGDHRFRRQPKDLCRSLSPDREKLPGPGMVSTGGLKGALYQRCLPGISPGASSGHCRRSIS